MKVAELLHRISTLNTLGSLENEVSEIVFDSRKVTFGSLYVAIKGTLTDGHQYINASIEKGANTIVCEELPNDINENITYIQVKNSQQTLGHLASNFYGNPSEKINLIGITGTNGKTSASTVLFEMFTHLGFRVALISTVENKIGDRIIPSTHTTPDIVTINQLLSDAIDEGCDYAFMEVSSIGIHQNRIEGLHFKIAGFTKEPA